MPEKRWSEQWGVRVSPWRKEGWPGQEGVSTRGGKQWDRTGSRKGAEGMGRRSEGEWVNRESEGGPDLRGKSAIRKCTASIEKGERELREAKGSSIVTGGRRLG